MDKELLKIIRSTYVPVLLVVLMVISYVMQEVYNWDMYLLGVLPLKWEGLPGVLTSIFVHKDFSHLLGNAVPILLLGSAVYYYYKRVAHWAVLGMTFATGLWVWMIGRESYHIGASGLVYALASFHVVSAILRRELRVMAFAMLVIFLYGSLVWGVFPEFFPERNISYEAHLMGGIAGLVFAIYYRQEGPQKPVPEEDEDEDDDSLGHMYAWPPEFYENEDTEVTYYYNNPKEKKDGRE